MAQSGWNRLKNVFSQKSFDNSAPNTQEIAQKLVTENKADRDQVLSLLAEHLKDRPYGSKEVIQALYTLTEKLVPKAGEYSAIVSDDSSGRLVSLVVKKVLDQQRQQVGEEKLPIWFVAAGKNQSNERALKDFIDKNQEALQNPLIVTEYMMTGESLVRLAGFFEQRGIHPNFAALATDMKADWYTSHLQNLRKSTLVVAQEDMLDKSNAGDPFYGDAARLAGGVKKDYLGTEAHPSSYKRDPDSLPDTLQGLSPAEIQEGVNQARQDIDLMARAFSLLIDQKRKQKK